MQHISYKKNENSYNYLEQAFQHGKLSHAYIIEGMGKEKFADDVSAALLCKKNKGNGVKTLKACGGCPACIKSFTGNHPDLIHVRHEKPAVVSVGEIREQVVMDVSVKPYYGPYKIYIIPDADLMNDNAQNALLKTIEEPEDYAMIFLLSDNADRFLQTIRSRCIKLVMDPEPHELTVKRLMENGGEQVLEFLLKGKSMDALEINKAAKELEAVDKARVTDVVKLWVRDLLVWKSTEDAGRLYFYEQKDNIKAISESEDYEKLNEMVNCVIDAQDRLNASVKAEAVYESLLLKFSE